MDGDFHRASANNRDRNGISHAAGARPFPEAGYGKGFAGCTAWVAGIPNRHERLQLIRKNPARDGSGPLRRGMLRLRLGEAAPIEVKVYDVRGNLLRSHSQPDATAGLHAWNLEEGVFPAGVRRRLEPGRRQRRHRHRRRKTLVRLPRSERNPVDELVGGRSHRILRRLEDGRERERRMGRVPAQPVGGLGAEPAAFRAGNRISREVRANRATPPAAVAGVLEAFRDANGRLFLKARKDATPSGGIFPAIP